MRERQRVKEREREEKGYVSGRRKKSKPEKNSNV